MTQRQILLSDVYDELYIDMPDRSALKLLYKLLLERPPVANITHREVPSFDDHAAFVMRRPHRFWKLIVDAETKKRVGAIYATERNEIGIGILKEYQGKGYGSAAVRLLTALYSPLPAKASVRSGQWIANVAPTNKASQVFFDSLGFKLVQLTYRLPEGGICQ